MSTTSTVKTTGVLPGSGQSVFSWGDMDVRANSDIAVIYIDADDAYALLSYGTHYSVDLVQGEITITSLPGGGSVPLGAATGVVIHLDLTFSQILGLTRKRMWDPGVHEAAFDYLMRGLLTLEGRVDNCIECPAADGGEDALGNPLVTVLPIASARAGENIALDDDGNVQAGALPVPGTTHTIPLGPGDFDIANPATFDQCSKSAISRHPTIAFTAAGIAALDSYASAAIKRISELGSGSITKVEILTASDQAEASKDVDWKVYFHGASGDIEPISGSALELCDGVVTTITRPDTANEVLKSEMTAVATQACGAEAIPSIGIGRDGLADTSVEDAHLLGVILTYVTSPGG